MAAVQQPVQGPLIIGQVARAAAPQPDAHQPKLAATVAIEDTHEIELFAGGSIPHSLHRSSRQHSFAFNLAPNGSESIVHAMESQDGRSSLRRYV